VIIRKPEHPRSHPERHPYTRASTIQELRESLELSHPQLAELLGAPAELVVDWACGTSVPTEPWVQTLTRRFGVTEQELNLHPEITTGSSPVPGTSG
jgi:DNA-binding transcriptional regulator YiaG